MDVRYHTIVDTISCDIRDIINIKCRGTLRYIVSFRLTFEKDHLRLIRRTTAGVTTSR
jgi:hypothetical protein